MKLIEKIQKAKEIVLKLKNSIDGQAHVLRGFEEYLGNYKSTYNPEERDLGIRYIDDTINILLTYIKMLNDVKIK